MIWWLLGPILYEWVDVKRWMLVRQRSPLKNVFRQPPPPPFKWPPKILQHKIPLDSPFDSPVKTVGTLAA